MSSINPSWSPTDTAVPATPAQQTNASPGWGPMDTAVPATPAQQQTPDTSGDSWLGGVKNDLSNVWNKVKDSTQRAIGYKGADNSDIISKAMSIIPGANIAGAALNMAGLAGTAATSPVVNALKYPLGYVNQAISNLPNELSGDVDQPLYDQTYKSLPTAKQEAKETIEDSLIGGLPSSSVASATGASKAAIKAAKELNQVIKNSGNAKEITDTIAKNRATGIGDQLPTTLQSPALQSESTALMADPGEASDMLTEARRNEQTKAALVSRNSPVDTFGAMDPDLSKAALADHRKATTTDLYSQAMKFGDTLAPFQDQYQSAWSDLGKQEQAINQQIAQAQQSDMLMQGKSTLHGTPRESYSNSVYNTPTPGQLSNSQKTVADLQSQLEGIQIQKEQALERMQAAQTDASSANKGVLWSPELENIMQTPGAGGAFKRGIDSMKRQDIGAGIPVKSSNYSVVGYDKEGNPSVNFPTMRSWQALYKDLGEQASELNDQGLPTSQAREAAIIKSRLGDELSRLNPTFGDANAKWSQVSNSMNALEAGKYHFKTPDTTNTLSARLRNFAELSDEPHTDGPYAGLSDKDLYRKSAIQMLTQDAAFSDNPAGSMIKGNVGKETLWRSLFNNDQDASNWMARLKNNSDIADLQSQRNLGVETPPTLTGAAGNIAAGSVLSATGHPLIGNPYTKRGLLETLKTFRRGPNKDIDKEKANLLSRPDAINPDTGYFNVPEQAPGTVSSTGLMTRMAPLASQINSQDQ